MNNPQGNENLNSASPNDIYNCWKFSVSKRGWVPFSSAFRCKSQAE